MSRMCRFAWALSAVAAFVVCGTTVRAGIIIDRGPQREFYWGTNRQRTVYDRVFTSDPYSRTDSGITQASTAITDSGFTMTTTGASPVAGVQWTQYVWMQFHFTEDTTIALSGTLFSPPPMIGDANGYQFVYLSDDRYSTYYFALTNNDTYLVPGPQPYSYSTTLTANKIYTLEANTSWADAIDGGTQTFMTFSAAPVAAVPEIDPAGMGSVLAFVGGALGLLERRRKRA